MLVISWCLSLGRQSGKLIKMQIIVANNTSVHLVIAKAICISNELLSFFQQLAWARVKRPSRPFCCLPNLFGRLSRLARPKPGLVWAAKLLGGESRSFMSNDKGPDPIINHLGPMLWQHKINKFYHNSSLTTPSSKRKGIFLECRFYHFQENFIWSWMYKNYSKSKYSY